MQIHKCLELDPDAETISCRECGETLCNANRNYKKYAAMRTGPVTDAGPPFEPPEEILGKDLDLEFRQFFCPNCAVLLDHSFARQDDEILHDIEIDVSSL
jgi:acetone carboxylase gamma subunit